MNKKLVWVVAALVVAIGAGAIYYFFVKDRNQHLKYIPAEVTMAVHFDLKSLRDKSDFEKVKKMKFFTELMDEHSHDGSNHEFTDVLLKKPLTAGIDVLSDPIFFMSTRNDKMFMGLSIKLTSSGDFNRLVKKYKTAAEPKKSDTYTSLELEEEKLFVAWNDEAAVFLSSPNLMNRSNSKAEIEKVLDIYMTQETKESLSENEDYHKFRKEKQDIGIFITYDKLFDFVGSALNSRRYYSQEMMDTKEQMDKMKEKFKGIKAGLTLSFESNALMGKILMYGENATKLMEQSGYTGKALSADFIKTISNDKILATLFFNYNMDKLIDYQLENPKYKEAINKFAEDLNMTVSDLKSILGGEFAFSLVDAEVLKEEKKYIDIDPITEEPIDKTRTVETPMPYFTISLSVKNDANLQKLVDNINKKMTPDFDTADAVHHAIEKRGANHYFKKNNVEISMIKTAIGYTITNSPKIAEALSKNKSLSSDPKLIGKEYFNNNSFGFKIILDTEKYPKTFIDYLKTQTRGEKTPWDILKNFKEISMQMPVGSTIEGKFEVKMTEGKGNSLYRLLEMIDEAK
ncbi:MAG: DUF4836 family protein [Bacteroidota bacterium]|nr:DUF4836 family protein [Bacteroidota bacterium]